MEFDFPPTEIIIYSKTSTTNWLPIIYHNLIKEFKGFVPKKHKKNFLIKCFELQNNFTEPMKHLKFRFFNKQNYDINVLFSRVKN